MRSPVLFIVFSRLDTTLRVLEQIRQAKPPRLYLTADGPRKDRVGEDLKCIQTREAVLAGIDWECEVKTRFLDENVGPKMAISSAVSWFFEHEEEGIILEHDCLPASSFFRFCDELLEKYRNDTRIWLISGSNLLKDRKWNEASYYFSQLTNGWGWATWRRSWEQYDPHLTHYTEEEVHEQLKKVFDDPFIIDTWTYLFTATKSGKIDTWDYQAGFAHMLNNGLNIVPNNNLVSNIGFGELAENTTDAESVFASIPLQEIGTIVHPKYMLPEKEADRLLLLEEFRPRKEYLDKYNAPHRRLKRWWKSLWR